MELEHRVWKGTVMFLFVLTKVFERKFETFRVGITQREPPGAYEQTGAIKKIRRMNYVETDLYQKCQACRIQF